MVTKSKNNLLRAFEECACLDALLLLSSCWSRRKLAVPLMPTQVMLPDETPSMYCHSMQGTITNMDWPLCTVRHHSMCLQCLPA
jgi:hypothetical protein